MTAHTCSITCTKPACVKRRIVKWVNDLAGDYVESWVGEMVAEEWCKDKSRILELMAENKQDGEIHKELDAYKLRAHLLKKKNNKLEEELKRVSSYVERLESRVDFLEMNEMPKAVLIQRLIEKFIHGLENDASEVTKEIKELMAEEPIPKRYTEEDWLVLQEAKDLLDELETEDEQDET